MYTTNLDKMHENTSYYIKFPIQYQGIRADVFKVIQECIHVHYLENRPLEDIGTISVKKGRVKVTSKYGRPQRFIKKNLSRKKFKKDVLVTREKTGFNKALVYIYIFPEVNKHSVLLFM